MISYHIMNGTVLNVAAFTLDRDQVMVPASLQEPWVKSTSTSAVLSAFEDFGSEALAILGCMDAPNKWSLHALHPPLETLIGTAPNQGVEPKYNRRNVVLVGDAAHAMLPHLGAGAGTGIEDVFVLTSLLAHPHTLSANLPVRPQSDSVILTREAHSLGGSLGSAPCVRRSSPAAYCGHCAQELSRGRRISRLWA